MREASLSTSHSSSVSLIPGIRNLFSLRREHGEQSKPKSFACYRMASVTAFSIVLMLFFVACGGGDSGEQAGQNDDGTQSEAPDNSSRASSGNAEDLIIGRWVELPNAQLGDSGGSILEFRSDGTYIGGGRTFSRQITGGDHMSLGGMPTEFTVTQDELVLIPSISGIAQTYRRFQTLAESPSTQRRPDASPSNAEIDLDVPQFLALGGSLPSGVDVGDVDGDGNQDIVTVNRGWPASDSSGGSASRCRTFRLLPMPDYAAHLSASRSPSQRPH